MAGASLFKKKRHDNWMKEEFQATFGLIVLFDVSTSRGFADYQSLVSADKISCSFFGPRCDIC